MVSWGAPATWIYAMTPTRLDPLAAGAILAVLAHDGGLERFGRRAVRTALVAGLAAELIVWAVGTTGPGDPRRLSLLVSVFAILWGAVLVVTLTTEGRWHRAMLSPPLRWLGRYSYALYLIQSPVRALLMAWGWGPAHIGRLRFALIAVPLCLAGAWASWHLWEKHWLALRDRVPQPGAAPRPRPDTSLRGR
jgi:peptidoglycan/LPS O-acetylase OafA/YrhL